MLLIGRLYGRTIHSWQIMMPQHTTLVQSTKHPLIHAGRFVGMIQKNPQYFLLVLYFFRLNSVPTKYFQIYCKL